MIGMSYILVMEKIKSFLKSLRKQKRITKIAQTCPIETCKLWGIPSLYDVHPDLIGR